MMLVRVLAAFFVLAAILVVLWFLGFRVNLTASLPLGVYRVSAEAPSRGSIVHVCLPDRVAEFARRRGYLGPGACPGNVRPLGKLVIAVGDDVVTLNPEEIRVNGEVVSDSPTASEDSRGRPLPHFPWGSHRLRKRELWLFSPYHSGAYDSRYFGPVRTSRVVSVLRAILVAARPRRG